MPDAAAPRPSEVNGHLGTIAWAMIEPVAPGAGSEALDPYLDATAKVLQRQGWSKTTIPDIARAMGVSRTTVYRQLGSVDSAVRTLAQRELRRLIDRLPKVLPMEDAAGTIAAAVVATVEFVSAHPVVKKLVHDEPGLLAGFAATAHPALVATLRPGIEPVLRAAIAAGAITPRDPQLVIEWLVRIGTSVVLHPPSWPLDDFVTDLVRSYLQPTSGGPR